MAQKDIIGTLAVFLLEETGSVYGRYKGTISAARQRELFGCKPFGKITVEIDGSSETIYASRTLAFGLDHASRKCGWLELERELLAGRNPFTLGRWMPEWS